MATIDIHKIKTFDDPDLDRQIEEIIYALGSVSTESGADAFLHIKYSNDGGITFTGNNGEEPGDWMGTYSDNIEADSNNPADYTWVKVKGDKGEDVPIFTWIKFADDASGTNMSDFPDGKGYIGLAYQRTAEIESNNPDDYVWSILGSAQSVEGPDGSQLHTWFKFADDELGTGMSDDPTGKSYIGLAFNRSSAIPSTDPSQYRWSTYLDSNGVLGSNSMAPGVFVTYHDNSVDTPPAKPTGDGTTGGWHRNATSSSNWMSQKVANAVTVGSWSDPILITGKDGADGTDGSDGVPGAYLELTTDEGIFFVNRTNSNDANGDPIYEYDPAIITLTAITNQGSVSWSIVGGTLTDTGDPTVKSVDVTSLTGEAATVTASAGGITKHVTLQKITATDGTKITKDGIYTGSLTVDQVNAVDIYADYIMVGGESKIPGVLAAQDVVDWASQITGAGKPADNADVTQNALNLGADIANAVVNGQTFIVGGFVNTDIVKVNSSLIVGDIDWQTQVGGAGKPADNADVTQDALDLGASIDNAKASGSTLIVGGYINTDIVKVNSSLIVGDVDYLTQVANGPPVDADKTSKHTVSGSNLLRNSAFLESLTGWNIYVDPAYSGEFYFGRNLSADWTLSGEGTAFINQSGTSNITATMYNTVGIPVVPGNRYEASVYIGPHRCGGYTYIEWNDSNNVILGTSGFSDLFESVGNTGGKNLSGYTRVGVFGIAPSGTSHAHIIIAKTPTMAGYNDSYLFVSRAYFGEAAALQQDLSAWVSGPTGDETKAAIESYTEVNSGGLKMTETSTGDYVHLTPGDLRFYENGMLYKSVRRVFAGEASGGDIITFNPPMKDVPVVQVSPKITQVPAGINEFWMEFYAKNVTINGFEVVANLMDGFLPTTSTVNSITTSVGGNTSIKTVYGAIGVEIFVEIAGWDIIDWFNDIDYFNYWGSYDKITYRVYYKKTTSSTWSYQEYSYSAFSSTINGHIPITHSHFFRTDGDDYQFYIEFVSVTTHTDSWVVYFGSGEPGSVNVAVQPPYVEFSKYVRSDQNYISTTEDVNFIVVEGGGS